MKKTSPKTTRLFLIIGILALPIVSNVTAGDKIPIQNVINSLEKGDYLLRSGGAFAVLKEDGSVITWGDAENGGDSTKVTDRLKDGVSSISATRRAFAALKDDGSVVTWGDPQWGGNSTIESVWVDYSNGNWNWLNATFKSVADDLKQGVVEVFSNPFAFAALKDDGSVVTWGTSYAGGRQIVPWGSPEDISSKLQGGVVSIVSSTQSFAALKNDGSVVTWGNLAGNSSSVAEYIKSGVRSLYSIRHGFAAMKENGSVVSWWHSGVPEGKVVVADGAHSLYTTNLAFAALKNDGSVVVWGDSSYGGEATVVSNQWSISENSYIRSVLKNVESDLQNGVVKIFSNYGAFAALKNDGSVVTWGNTNYGGDSSSVAKEISGGVEDIKTSYFSGFKALKKDGSTVSWGNPYYSNDVETEVKTISSGGYILEQDIKNDKLLSISSASFTGSSDYSGGGSSSESFTEVKKQNNKGKAAKKGSSKKKEKSAKKSSGSKKSSAKKSGGGSKKSSAKKSSGGGKKKSGGKKK